MPMISNDDLGLVIICMVRYALHRKTYIISQVTEFVRDNYFHLSMNDRITLKRDIEREIRLASEINRTVGDKCDDDDWHDLLTFIEENEVQHVKSCRWHTDWHACNCGLFDSESF